ncbi:MAG: hypothetical protein ABIW82_17355 [Dokdonella sp.]
MPKFSRKNREGVPADPPPPFQDRHGEFADGGGGAVVNNAITWFVERASFDNDRLDLIRGVFFNDALRLTDALRHSSLSILSSAPRDAVLDLQLTAQALEAMRALQVAEPVNWFSLFDEAARSLSRIFHLPIFSFTAYGQESAEQDWTRRLNEQADFLAVDVDRLLKEISSNTLLEHARATALITQQATQALAGLDDIPIVRAANEIAASATDDDVPQAAANGRALRDHLIANHAWWTSQEVAERLRGAVLESNPSEPASRLRREGRLFGVRHGNKTLHPPFQLDEQGELRPGLERLIALLPASPSNWTAAFWLFQPTARLAGQCPADVFPSDPERAIQAAEKDFRGAHDEW